MNKWLINLHVTYRPQLLVRFWVPDLSLLVSFDRNEQHSVDLPSCRSWMARSICRNLDHAFVQSNDRKQKRIEWTKNPSVIWSDSLRTDTNTNTNTQIQMHTKYSTYWAFIKGMYSSGISKYAIRTPQGSRKLIRKVGISLKRPPMTPAILKKMQWEREKNE